MGKTILSNEGALKLMAAVLNRAKDDYIYGCPHTQGNPREIRNFLRSDYGSMYTEMAGVTSNDIINNWDEQKAHEKWRERMGCKNCPLKKSKKKNRDHCIHEERGHYTEPRECRFAKEEENG